MGLAHPTRPPKVSSKQSGNRVVNSFLSNSTEFVKDLGFNAEKYDAIAKSKGV